MTQVHQLSDRQARRIAITAQWLHAQRAPDLLTLVRHLGMVQLDPTNAVAPSADLVVWSRLGSGIDRDAIEQALADRTLVEFRGCLRPGEDIALYRAEMRAFRESELPGWLGGQQRWVQANDAARREILLRLTTGGPLPPPDLPDAIAVPWQSSGWNANRNLTMLLEMMVKRGEVAIAGREGRHKLWDLAERVYPDSQEIPAEQALRIRNERRLASLGLARRKAPEHPVEPLDVGDVGEPAVVDGVPGDWRVQPELVDAPFRGRAALLSPLDRMLHDRKRMEEIFDFEYVLEMYKPAHTRRWGYYALPVLYGDRLVGKLDAKADRRSGVLTVHKVHWDVITSTAMIDAVDKEIDGLAGWLGLQAVRES